MTERARAGALASRPRSLWMRAMRLDGRIESKLVVLGVAGGILFLTLVATLFLVQRAFVRTNQQLTGIALPAETALAQFETALASAFERQAKLLSTRTMDELTDMRDRSAIEAALRHADDLLTTGLSGSDTREILAALPAHERVFLSTDRELLMSIERRHRLRATFESQLSKVDGDIGTLIQDSNALSGILHFDHVVVLRRLARQMRSGPPAPDLVRSEVVGGGLGRMDDVAELVQGVISLGRLAGKSGLALTDDALNSIAANEIVQNNSQIDRLLGSLARETAPGSDVARRIHELTEQFRAVAPRISDETRPDGLVALRRDILAEFARSRQILQECTRSARLLTGDLAVLERLSRARTETEVRWSARTTSGSQLASLLVALFGLITCVGAAVGIRNSVRILGATNSELADLRDNLEMKVAKRTAELTSSREQYRLLVETTKTIPFELDCSDLRFRYIGPQALGLLGVTRQTWSERGFLPRHLHPDDKDHVMSTLTGASTKNAGNVDLEMRLRRTGTDYIWIRLIAAATKAEQRSDHDGAPVNDLLFGSPWERSLFESGTGGNARRVLRGILLDVTQTHLLEIQLRQAQKLESVGRLASGVAHEINTPVQFVSDNVHFLKDAFADLGNVLARHRELRRAVIDGSASPEMAAEVAEAEETADISYILDAGPTAISRSIEGLGRIADIVRSMKEFAHPDRKEMAEVDLNQALMSTLTMARNEYKYVAETETDLQPMPPVMCHAGEVNQVFLNIIVNAAHAIGDVVKGTDKLGRIRISSRREADEVVVTISDTGGGIPEHIRDRIFDPFFTTKEVGKGTGQGLAIARSVIVDKHRGKLEVQSEIGVGTTFVIRLLIHGSPEQQPKEIAA